MKNFLPGVFTGIILMLVVVLSGLIKIPVLSSRLDFSNQDFCHIENSHVVIDHISPNVPAEVSVYIKGKKKEAELQAICRMFPSFSRDTLQTGTITLNGKDVTLFFEH